MLGAPGHVEQDPTHRSGSRYDRSCAAQSTGSSFSLMVDSQSSNVCLQPWLSQLLPHSPMLKSRLTSGLHAWKGGTENASGCALGGVESASTVPRQAGVEGCASCAIPRQRNKACLAGCGSQRMLGGAEVHRDFMWYTYKCTHTRTAAPSPGMRPIREGPMEAKQLQDGPAAAQHGPSSKR